MKARPSAGSTVMRHDLMIRRLIVDAVAFICTYTLVSFAQTLPPSLDTNERLRQIVLDLASTPTAVSNALRELGPSRTDFLSRVYNHSEFSPRQRRLCFFARVRSFGRPGKSLSEFADLLDHPKWITETNIYECWALTGSLRVTMPLGGNVILIDILPEAHENDSFVCLSFPRPVTNTDLVHALHGDLSSHKGMRFNEIGIIEGGNPEPNEQRVRRWEERNKQAREVTELRPVRQSSDLNEKMVRSVENWYSSNKLEVPKGICIYDRGTNFWRIFANQGTPLEMWFEVSPATLQVLRAVGD